MYLIQISKTDPIIKRSILIYFYLIHFQSFYLQPATYKNVKDKITRSQSNNNDLKYEILNFFHFDSFKKISNK